MKVTLLKCVARVNVDVYTFKIEKQNSHFDIGKGQKFKIKGAALWKCKKQINFIFNN